jgi:periplasmic protein TonB
MFDTLVESGSHKADVTRKGSFILGTIAVYAIVIVTVMVVAIWYYEATLDDLELELVTLVAPVPVQQVQPDQPKEAPKQAPSQERQVATRTDFIASALDPSKIPDKPSAVASKVPPVPPGGAVKGTVDSDPVGGGGPIGAAGGTGAGGGGAIGPTISDADEPPPPPVKTPTPAPKKTTVSGGVLNGKAISKPPLVYPPVAKAARVSGTVNVQVVVDETGKVVSASAVSGHPLLRQAAQQAAYGWRFSPTLLSGTAVKVTGTIVFNYTLQ